MSDFEDRVRDELHQLAEGAEPGPTLRQRIDARLGTGPPPSGRPPVALAAVAAAILLVATALVVLSVRDHGNGHKLVLTQGTSTTAGPTSTLGVAPGVSSVTAASAPPASDSTTAAPTTTATTVNPTTSTGAPTTTSTGSTTTVAVVDCTSVDLQTRTATDKPAYAAGETVTITVTVKNVSAHRCLLQNPMPNPFANAVTISPLNNPATPVWQPARLVNGTVVNVDPRPLAPNESYTWATVLWNQDQCVSPCAERAGSNPPRVPVPAIYQVSPLNAPGSAAPASFLLKSP